MVGKIVFVQMLIGHGQKILVPDYALVLRPLYCLGQKVHGFGVLPVSIKTVSPNADIAKALACVGGQPRGFNEGIWRQLANDTKRQHAALILDRLRALEKLRAKLSVIVKSAGLEADEGIRIPHAPDVL